jgi:hypothetical protein
MQQGSFDRRTAWVPPPRPDWVKRVNDECSAGYQTRGAFVTGSARRLSLESVLHPRFEGPKPQPVRDQPCNNLPMSSALI